MRLSVVSVTSTMLDKRSHRFLKGGTHIGFAGKVRPPAKLTIELLSSFTTPINIQNQKGILKMRTQLFLLIQRQTMQIWTFWKAGGLVACRQI